MIKADGYYDYHDGVIDCTCGKRFYSELEEELESHLTYSTVESEAKDIEFLTCPHCDATYTLKVYAEKIIETSSSIELTGKRVTSTDNRYSFDSKAISERWIGEEIYILNHNDEKVAISDGVYYIGEKEYHIKDGILENIWAIPDENQLSLFEESITE